jgi:hypothetical protein
MGYYYEREPEEKPPGCLDALVITRAALAVVLIPLGVLLLFLVDVVVTFALFTIHPALALVTIVPSVIGIWLFARWEQRRFRPPGL